MTDDEIERFNRLIARKLGTDVSFKITQTRVKGKVSIERKGNLAETTKMLRKLPDIIIDGYYAKQVSASHLFIIARLHDYVTMLTVYEKVLAENLTSPQTEDVVRELLYQVKAEGERMTDDEIERFNRLFARKLGTDVSFKITQTRVKGKVSIEQKGNLAETTKMLRKLYKILSAE
jgi:hypothetical protein